MGASIQPLLSLDLKGMALENKGHPTLEAIAMRRRQERKQRIKRINGGHGWIMRTMRVLMKRKALPEGSRRPLTGMGRRVRTLKRLVPNGKSMDLDGLFKETADYILSLQMQVRVMQIMVNALSGSNEQ